MATIGRREKDNRIAKSLAGKAVETVRYQGMPEYHEDNNRSGFSGLPPVAAMIRGSAGWYPIFETRATGRVVERHGVSMNQLEPSMEWASASIIL